MHTEGKVALVTGSSRGIGRGIACELASRGARVAVHYRADREAAQETLASLAGGPHAVFGADVAEAASVSFMRLSSRSNRCMFPVHRHDATDRRRAH